MSILIALDTQQKGNEIIRAGKKIICGLDFSLNFLPSVLFCFLHPLAVGGKAISDWVCELEG